MSIQNYGGNVEMFDRKRIHSFHIIFSLVYMVLPDQLMDVYKQHSQVLEQTASSLHQRTMHYFMEEDYWYSHLRKMRIVYKRKMKTLIDAVQMDFKEKVSVIGAAAGLYIVLEVDTEKSEEWLIQKAAESGVKVYPCSPYFINRKPQKPSIQLGFAGLLENEIVEGVKNINNCLERVSEQAGNKDSSQL